MSRTGKPTFVLSKGEREAQGNTVYTGDIEEHYRQIAGGLYKWDGLPDGCPRDFIESSALFYSPGVGCKKARGMGEVIAPIKPATLTVYGTPYDWIPVPLRGMMPIAADSEFFEPSNDPSLWMSNSIYDNIEPYLRIMSQTLKVLNTNVIGLSQPIMISGLPNAPLKGLILKSELMDGETYIPVAGRDGISAEVLDLKAQDHTANLISTIDWCDARILEIMASSNGVQKSSGITTMETVSGVQSVIQQFDIGLEKRKAWADQVNDRFKMDLSVEAGRGIDSLLNPGTNGNAPSEDEDNEDDTDGQRSY